MPTSERTTGTSTFDHANYLGTFTRQTNSSQSTKATRVYDAFGNLESTTGTPQSPFGFVGSQGYQEDGDSGLKLLGHRYYDPSTGRFLTRDPEKDGRNWFTYCESNPLRQVDPSGLTGWTIEMYVNFLSAVATGESDTIITMIEIFTGDDLPAEAVEAIGELPKPTSPVRINGNTIRNVQGIVTQVRTHILKIAKNPGSRAVNHWKGDIKVMLKQIYSRLRN